MSSQLPHLTWHYYICRHSLKKNCLFLEFLTKAYNDACSKGEVMIYRAHLAVLGHSSTVSEIFIEKLLDGSIRYPLVSPYGMKGIKTSLIKSKFNKATQKTQRWRQSRRNSSEVMTELRQAVLSHIRSLQHEGEAEGEMETSQRYHPPTGKESKQKKSFITRFESNQNERKGDRQHIAYKFESPKKESAAQYPKLDKETLLFLHKNQHIQAVSDNNIPYSINWWDCERWEIFSTMYPLFFKAEALMVFVMDTSLDLFSPLERRMFEFKINENPKTPAESLAYWLSSVHAQAKKQNFKPNIILLLTHANSTAGKEPSKYHNYIKTTIEMVEGKPYADYISKENIICGSFNDVRGKLFDRIRKLPSWGVKKPIQWLALEAELLRRTTYGRYGLYEKKPYLLFPEVKELASTCDMDDHEVESFLQFHHALGDLIYCPPSKRERYIITNP